MESAKVWTEKVLIPTYEIGPAEKNPIFLDKRVYSEGVDISRYKNIPVPTSCVVEKSKYDFVDGYDYGVGAGILHVADHHISPGKKQWTWGCGDFGGPGIGI